MANVTLWGASYSNVPALTVPKTGGGTVTFYEDGGGGGASQSIYTGTSAPASSLGENGDVYILASAGCSTEVYPADYQASGMSQTSHAGDCIGTSADDG